MIFARAEAPRRGGEAKTELAHGNRFIRGASGPYIGYASLYISDIQKGEAPGRGGEAKNRARS